MSKTIIKELRTIYERPVIYVQSESKQYIDCMLDTGANTPVWTMDENVLCHFFPNAKKVEGLHYHLGGFGGDGEDTPVYIIPDFIIKSDIDENFLCFKNLAVACCDRKTIGHPMILSATMFRHTNYEICYYNVEKPVLKIEYPKNEFQTGIIYSNDRKDKISGIYSFAADSRPTS